jgi:hypothetical protein
VGRATLVLHTALPNQHVLTNICSSMYCIFRIQDSRLIYTTPFLISGMYNVKSTVFACIHKLINQRWASKLFLMITNPQILWLIPLFQIRKFLLLIRKSQIRKSIQNTAQLCLKTDLKLVFLIVFLKF